MKTKLLLILLLTGLFYSAQAQLKQVYTANFYLTDMYCLNADTVFVCGDRGKLLRTTDGGTTWQKDSLPTKFNLTSVIMRNSGIGYCSGDSGTFFQTTNYGNNWSKISTNIKDNLNNLKFYNDSCGYESMGSSIFRTTNYGRNWNFIRQFEYLNNVTCFGKDTLFAGTFDGLFYTYNAGLKWDSTIIGPVEGMSWLNNSIGFVANGYDLEKTVDAGKTFIGTGFSNATLIYAVNDTIIYGSSFLSLGMLSISKTINGAQTWDNNPEFAPQKIIFHDKDVGYMLYGQFIYKTTNGCIYTYKDCSIIIGSITKMIPVVITIAPNPMESFTFIGLPASCPNAHYKLYNNLGRVVEENSITSMSNQIFRGNKSPGVYFISITDSKGILIASQKLIIL